jgi:hypothetical protein
VVKTATTFDPGVMGINCRKMTMFAFDGTIKNKLNPGFKWSTANPSIKQYLQFPII